MRLLLVAYPGAGKGTQAEKLAAHYGIEHLSSGDLLRHEVVDGTKIGRVAAEYLERGDLVPDDLLFDMLLARVVNAARNGGYVLDGFPRTVGQAEKLENLVGNGTGGVRVVQLLVPDDVIVKRIALRRSCPQCGAIYHMETAPPRNDQVCDRDGAELIARPDDNEQAVRTRLEAFHRQTLPVATFYKTKSVLRQVDGVGPADQVFERIEKSLS